MLCCLFLIAWEWGWSRCYLCLRHVFGEEKGTGQQNLKHKRWQRVTGCKHRRWHGIHEGFYPLGFSSFPLNSLPEHWLAAHACQYWHNNIWKSWGGQSIWFMYAGMVTNKSWVITSMIFELSVVEFLLKILNINTMYKRPSCFCKTKQTLLLLLWQQKEAHQSRKSLVSKPRWCHTF